MPRYSYTIITGFYGTDMLEELDAKGSEGYRLVSVIVNPKLDAPLIAYMEKTSTSKPKKKKQTRPR